MALLLAHLLLFLHLLGMAVLVGGFSAQLSTRPRRVTPGQWHGALLSLLSGLALVALYELNPDLGEPLNHAKVALKLLVALAITLLAWRGRRQPQWARGWLLVGLLALLNTGLAVFW
jgi:hypothetical protein